jgi:spermidine synthase
MRNLEAMPDPKKVFTLNQAFMAAYSLALPVLFPILASSNSGKVLWAGSNIIFILLPFLAGLPVGFQFPLANKIYAGKGKGPGSSAGLIYGADLSGSCLGALLASAVLVPILGMGGACLFASVINIAISIMLLL